MRVWVVGLLSVGLVACSASQPPAYPAVPTSTPAITEQSETLLLPTSLRMPTHWKRLMCIPYGPEPAQLGLADDHGGQATAWGPEYGAPAPDGSWWFLDNQKRRLAHYDAHGGYLGAVHIPGRYVGLQLLHVFRDGTMFASAGADARDALIATPTRARRVDIPAQDLLSWFYDDGHRAYGTGSGAAPSQTLSIVHGGPVVADADSYRTPTGSRFSLRVVDGGSIVVELSDAHPSRRLTLRLRLPTGGPQEPIPVLEFAAGADGVLHLMVYGSSNDTPRVSFAGYLSISPDGELSAIEPIALPFSDVSPGSPASLHVRPGGSEAALVYVDHDCTAVYVRRA